MVGARGRRKHRGWQPMLQRYRSQPLPSGGHRLGTSISGNNAGPPAEEARDRAVADGIGVNGLAIVNDYPPFAYAGPVPLEDYYRDAVIGGPGAFVVVAEDFRGFARAVRRKLIREIA